MSCRDHWGLEFTVEEIAAARAGNKLLSLELELSRACNMRCIYCYAASGVALENELTLPEIYGVIDQAVALGVRKIIVLGGGEPLLFEPLLEVIEYILAKKVEVDLFTNGLLMTPAKAQTFYDLGVGVVLKMNSRNPRTQDLLAGQKGAFRAIEQAYTALREAGYPDRDHVLGIETIICGPNYEEIPTLWRWARSQGVVPYVEIMTLQGRATDHPELEVPSAELKKLFEELARLDGEEFGHQWTPHPPLAASHCARHEYSCTVTSVGDVQPCPGVSVKAGNIRESSLAEIIHQSPVIQELRNIRTTIKGSCGECDLGDLCYGCRGHAYQLTGDYLAADPLCWLSQAAK